MQKNSCESLKKKKMSSEKVLKILKTYLMPQNAVAGKIVKIALQFTMFFNLEAEY